MRHLLSICVLIACSMCGLQPITAEQLTHHTFRYLRDSGYPQTFRTMVFSPDSAQLAVSLAGKVDFIDPQLGRITGQHKSSPFSMGYAKNGEHIHMISENRTVLLDTLTGAELKTKYEVAQGYLGVRLEKQSGKLLVAKISEGGPVAAIDEIQVGDELIAVAEGRNGSMRNVTGRSVQEAATLLKGAAGAYLQLKILSPGRFGEEHARVYVVRRQPGAIVGNAVRFKEYTPAKTGENLTWCVADKKHAFRSAATGLPIARLETIDIQNVGQYAISPDQKKFAVVARQKAKDSGNAVEVFDIATQDRLAFMPVPKGSYSSIAFASDNNRVLVAAWDSVEIADVEKQCFVGRLNLGRTPRWKKKKDRARGGGLGGAAVRATADAIASGGDDDRRSSIKLVSQIAVSSKDVVATGDHRGHVKLWDLNTDELLQTLPKNPAEEPEAITFSPDGKWLAYHIHGVLHVVDVSDIEPLSEEKVALHGQQEQEGGKAGEDISGLEVAAPDEAASFVPEVGAKVEVRSRGLWYPAMIVRRDGKGRWQIHYDDSSEDWDELVTERRMRPRTDL